MVAKSYQKLIQIGEPFVSNGRQYVKVQTNKNTTKTVRWYTEAEYARMYPNDNVAEDQKTTVNQKKILGFEKGYITIFKGNTYDNKDYFKLSKARYCRWWGWYFVSTDELPDDLPEDVEPITLPWELVGKDDNTLKSDSLITEAVESLIYDADISEFQGEIGDRLNITVTVTKTISLDSYFGRSTMHIMRDEQGNCYVWTTSAKSWTEKSKHTIAGTVKDHRTYKGVKQTILTRCRSLDN